MSPDTIPLHFSSLNKNHHRFLELFTGQIINIGPAEGAATVSALRDFVSDYDIQSVYNDCKQNFQDLSLPENELTAAFKRYKYFFPDKTVPEVTAFISGFNYSIVTGDSLTGIGLDMYMGADYNYYTMLGFPLYRRWNMNKNAISADCLRGWLTAEFAPGISKQELIYSMIHHGKILYLLEILFPEAHDSLIAGYSAKQVEWCRGNIVPVWSFFIDKQLFYSTDYSENNKYLNEGPFTPGMPQASPGGIGKWLGWQVVRAYMKRFDELSPAELMNEPDHRKIFMESHFRPGA